MGDWRYLAYRLNGDGTETLLGSDLPLTGVSVTQTLSGPDKITATVPLDLGRFKLADGAPLFRPWSTAVYAERDGDLVTGAIVTRPQSAGDAGQALTLETTGWTGYASGTPYRDDRSWVLADPMAIAAHMWTHIQAWRGANIGLEVPAVSSPVRVGTKATRTMTTTKDENGKPVTEVTRTDGQPYRLAWYATPDLGVEFDNLATATPFDYRTDHWWDGERARHRLVRGYPRLGKERPDLRFVMGENVLPLPQVGDDPDRSWTDVLAVGAGEGAKAPRAVSSASGRSTLARWKVLQVKDMQVASMVTAAARRALAASAPSWGVREVTVLNTPMCPIGAWDLGDTVTIGGPTAGWASGRDYRGRIVAQTFDPVNDTCTLTLVDPAE